jgi:hypothetical protein
VIAERTAACARIRRATSETRPEDAAVIVDDMQDALRRCQQVVEIEGERLAHLDSV